jgi:hypothetical protein
MLLLTIARPMVNYEIGVAEKACAGSNGTKGPDASYGWIVNHLPDAKIALDHHNLRPEKASERLE